MTTFAQVRRPQGNEVAADVATGPDREASPRGPTASDIDETRRAARIANASNVKSDQARTTDPLLLEPTSFDATAELKSMFSDRKLSVHAAVEDPELLRSRYNELKRDYPGEGSVLQRFVAAKCHEILFQHHNSPDIMRQAMNQLVSDLRDDYGIKLTDPGLYQRLW